VRQFGLLVASLEFCLIIIIEVPIHSMSIAMSDDFEVPSYHRRKQKQRVRVSHGDDGLRATKPQRSVNISKPPRFSHEPLRRITLVHDDDIHTLLQVDKEHFISGSKDCTVKLWTVNGDSVKNLYTPDASSYKRWVTCSAITNTGTVVCGFRDGSFRLWQDNFRSSQCWERHASAEFKSKQRNKNRVNCIVADGQDHILAGSAIEFSEWDVSQDPACIATHSVSANDWVYCIERLNVDKLLVVIGSNLETYTTTDQGRSWKRMHIHIDGNKQHRYQTAQGQQRPHISAIQRIRGSSLVACACFDGVLRWSDLEADVSPFKSQAHKGRVWTVLSVPSQEQQQVVTSGDDGCICFWDYRTRSKVKTISGHEGRVSQLMFVNDMQLLAASCPDNPHSSKAKGQFTYWDMRTL